MAERLCMGCMEKVNDKYEVCPYCGYVDGTPAKEAYHIAPGNVLAGKYIVGKVIGYGGFGVTYIGYDGLLEKKIAIKEYLPSEFATRMPGQTEVTVYSGERQEQFYSGIDKFVEEAKRLAQFKDVPGVVRIFDSFTENKTAYIIMEYLEGETLKERLEREGKLPIDEALNIIMPILGALKEVHKIGIIHRDIAPDNIFLTNQGEVKLLDFGAARYATTTHSKSLSVIIKQGYAPEEQYRSKGDQGPWTDVYACGATLYKMLTGVTPEDSMERAGKDNLQPISKYGVKISKNLNTAIMNAMNIRIEDRTQSAEEFETELLSEEDVIRKKAHSRKMDIGKWPMGIKIAAGAVASGLLVFGVLLATGVIHFDMQKIIDNGLLASNEVYVPNLVNSVVEEAETQTLSRGLILQITDKQNSDEIPRDKILSQNLPDGSVVTSGTTIEIVVSAGGEIVYLGDIEGLTQEEVIAMLEALGLVVEVREEESDIAPGCVIRFEATKDGESVDAENGVEKGTTITIYVSTGRSDFDENADTTVPQVVGLSYADATTAATNAKLYIYKIRSEYSRSVPKGQVMEQNLEAGSTVKQGTRLGVVISLGEETTRVPDVQYKDAATAANMLTGSNLSYEYQYEDSDTVAKDHVIRQSVAAGSEVEVQTKVILYISKGNPNANKTETEVAANDTTASSGTTANSESTITEASTEPSTEASTKPSTEASTEPSTKPSTEPSDTKVMVPNLVGKTETEAKTALQNAGLAVGTIEYYSSTSKSSKTVLGQEIASGSKVEKGTTVDLDVCNNQTHTEYQEIIVTTNRETTESKSSSLAGWTCIGYHYGNWGATVDNGTTYIAESWDGSTQIRKVWRDAKETNPYPYPTQNWYQGKSSVANDEVKWIQYSLNYTDNMGLTIDGIFGANTRTAVGSFQYYNGLTVDYQAGPNTYAKMAAAFDSVAENKRHYWYQEKEKIYDFEKINTTTTYGSWTTTKPTGDYNTRQVNDYPSY